MRVEFDDVAGEGQGLSPASVREVFGRNLNTLIGDRRLGDVAAALGLNRTQLNRFRSGAAFPRPDVLKRICTYFGTDARILTEPLPVPGAADAGLISAELSRLVEGAGVVCPLAEELPRGFYRLVRHSPLNPGRVIVSLVYVNEKRRGVVTTRAYADPRSLAEIRLPARFPLPVLNGLVLAMRTRLAIVTSLSESHTLNFMTLMPDQFQGPGHYSGSVLITGWGEAVTGRNQVLMTHLPDWRAAIHLRRHMIGPRYIADLPPEERPLFES